MIDRDQGCHSEQQLIQLLFSCRQSGCACFISNPCFEFWLLLHVSDVKREYAGDLEKLQNNERLSNKHTFISYELSKKAGHTKDISEKKFISSYLPNIDRAILRAKEFEQDADKLIYKLGTNLPELFKMIREEI